MRERSQPRVCETPWDATPSPPHRVKNDFHRIAEALVEGTIEFSKFPGFCIVRSEEETAAGKTIRRYKAQIVPKTLGCVVLYVQKRVTPRGVEWWGRTDVNQEWSLRRRS